MKSVCPMKDESLIRKVGMISLRLHDVKSVEKRLHHADLRSMSEGGGRNYEKFCESFGIITLHSNTMSCMYEVDKRLE